jgi:ABC-type Mn2+/Zn2+ transport system permease subunit
VTSSVRIAGVLLVFFYLIVLALPANTRGGSVARRPWIGWALGPVVSVVGLAAAAALLDLPTGATVACVFGLIFLVWSGLSRRDRPPSAAALHDLRPVLTKKGESR